MRRGTVWIAEDDERDENGDWFWCATFSGFHDTGAQRRPEEFSGLAVDEAIEWGRARAGRVYVTLADGGRYSAGTTNVAECPPWPPADLPPLVRRRPSGEEWKDRTPSDPAIDWQVTAWLSRADGVVPGEERDREVAAIATQAGAVAWDSDSLTALRSDVLEATRDAGGQGAGWFSYHRPAYRLQFQACAPTARAATESVAHRLHLTEGWTAGFEAEPL